MDLPRARRQPAVLRGLREGLRRLADWLAIDYSEAEGEYSAENCRKSAAREAIYSADSTAEREAEAERDYQREEDRKRQAEEAREELAANRATEPKQMGPEKRLFAFSILYLFLLFAVLVADKWMLA